jgi:diaminohydroxyphosphoribosylaminopyrimidine deaminase/5-amino-6-(5-phosphoribosylamino)uracil reductase
VLGAWLEALARQRPSITWPYLLTESGIAGLPEDISEAVAVRLDQDAVLHPDGHVEEAVPDSHGAGILLLKDIPPGVGPGETAELLYAGGVRRLLLQGGLDLAAPFLAASLIDRVIAYLPAGASSRRPAAEPAWPLFPPDFKMTDITRVDGFVCTVGERA